jgi:hypothetical protein|tara:strand:+ start:2836 stop:3045 length:210 start_codon:yes stop_codon:yes gene_type:complete
MAIRVEMKRSESKGFPKLMYCGHLVVLFTDEGVGMVMSSDRHNPVGTTSDVWVMEKFRTFEGELILKNL